MFNTEVMFDI